MLPNAIVQLPANRAVDRVMTGQHDKTLGEFGKAP
jgi:hypothetical protein